MADQYNIVITVTITRNGETLMLRGDDIANHYLYNCPLDEDAIRQAVQAGIESFEIGFHSEIDDLSDTRP